VKDYIVRRVTLLAEFVLKTNATVRSAAKNFGISKSTVHKDVTERLLEIDPLTAVRVAEILAINLQERHIRGGEATKKKFRKKN